MALLNYTTSVEAAKTVSEIVELLARHGARSVSQQYADGEPVGVAFEIDTAYGLQAYVLPMDPEPVRRVLVKQYNAGKVDRRRTTEEHAKRVGWRIMKDWLLAQLALIETGLVSLDQVMMPYMMLEGRTVYQLMRENLLQIPERAGVR